MLAVTSLCANIIREVIVKMEAIVTNNITIISAKGECVEVVPAWIDTPGHVNILQIVAFADSKINALMHTLVEKTRQRQIFWKEILQFSKMKQEKCQKFILKVIEIQLEFSREYTSTDKSHPHSKESEKQTDTTEQEDNIFKCYLCDFKSASKKTLRKHLNIRHPNNKTDIEDKVDDSESRLECSHCHQKFLTKKNWSEHVEEHMKEIENDNNFEQFIKECQKDLLDDSEDDYSASESED